MDELKLGQYPFEIRPLAPEEGGGYLISFPDFTQCIADGETPEDAIQNGRDALKSVILTLMEFGDPVPEPFSGGAASGKFVTRVPKNLHAKLATRARAEGVSMNALVTSILAEHVGR
ncbi:MAG: type II toxin-antitoxin system HicB family antitoxin [Magnetococcales bacterium]|nr:type II toxin-antitoxin system HicB family antitoxin [Magnetococcales bacterium]MBF0157264.1 type II toxin-antitoxin system HicB family antitoxin [Magnetococcales bacterium]